MPIHEVLFVFVFVFVALNVLCFACRGFRYFQSIVWISPIAQVLVPQVRSFRLLPFSVSGNPKFIVSCTSNSLFVMSPHVFGVAPTLCFWCLNRYFRYLHRVVLFVIYPHVSQVPPTFCFWFPYTWLRYLQLFVLWCLHTGLLFVCDVSTHVWGTLTLCFWCLHTCLRYTYSFFLFPPMSEVALLFVSGVST